MKYLVFMLLLFGLSLSGTAQFKSINFSMGAGYTLVNFDKAVGVDDLEEWDNIGAMIKVSVDFQLRDNLFLVGEVGTNRLYYWEYYWSDGYYSGYRFGTDWTSNLVVQLKGYLSDRIFLQSGIGLHFYNDGSGMVPGDVVQIGYEIPLNDKITIPVLVRMENVWGQGSPSLFMLGAGASYKLFK